MGKIKTYNPKEVTIALGNHIVVGYADDSFITIDPNGDGVTKKVGCDGEIVRSISPDDTYIVKLTVLQTSETNSFLQNRFKQDRQTGDGMFPILIKDLKGGMVFSSDAAWPAKPASRGFGKESNNREWELHTGSGAVGAEYAMAEAEMMEGVSIAGGVQHQMPKVKGISQSKTWEICESECDWSKVPVSLIGIELRPVDKAAVLRLIKMSKGQVEIPGIKFRETYTTSVSTR